MNISNIAIAIQAFAVTHIVIVVTVGNPQRTFCVTRHNEPSRSTLNIVSIHADSTPPLVERPYG